jgi:thiol:disulfide interchange protein
MQPAHYQTEGNQMILSLPATAVGIKITAATFFPRQQNIIHYATETKLSSEKNTLQIALEKTDKKPEGDISGILSLTANGEQKNVDITFAPMAAAAVEPALWLPVVMLLAVLGGLVLNLMPCVLPVLSLKALAIAKKSGHEHKVVVRMGVAYTLGILVSFGVIAGILIALRQAGESVGWGYQMQSPAFVAFLIYLLFLVGLNLSGLFHLPVLLGNVGIGDETSAKGSFFTGVLATMVATPCTAPFMASAVGVALTLPAFESLLVFEALGFGLALPFLAISLFPRLLRFLPKPGAWMDTFKQLLAFPMYASVIWLLWVLTLQTGAGGMVVALTGMLAIIIVIWMKQMFSEESKAYRVVALVIYALVIGVSLPALSRMEIGSHAAESMEKMGFETVMFSKAKLAELQSAGKPVFVDATAAWCITCQFNGRVAIRTERVMNAFKEKGVTLMIADWTSRNDEITEFLSGFGYKGVPLYVFYPAHGQPVVLPQLLTEDIVINAISQ